MTQYNISHVLNRIGKKQYNFSVANGGRKTQIQRSKKGVVNTHTLNIILNALVEGSSLSAAEDEVNREKQ